MKTYYLDYPAYSLRIQETKAKLAPKSCYRNVYESIIQRIHWLESSSDELEVCYGYLKIPQVAVAVRHCFMKQGDLIIDPSLPFLPKGVDQEPYYIFKTYSTSDYLHSLAEADGEIGLFSTLRTEDYEFQKVLIKAGLTPIG